MDEGALMFTRAVLAPLAGVVTTSAENSCALPGMPASDVSASAMAAIALSFRDLRFIGSSVKRGRSVSESSPRGDASAACDWRRNEGRLRDATVTRPSLAESRGGIPYSA